MCKLADVLFLLFIQTAAALAWQVPQGYPPAASSAQDLQLKDSSVLHVEIIVDQTEFGARKEVPFTVVATPRVDMKHVAGQVEVSGPVTLKGKTKLEWGNLRAYDTAHGSGSFRIDDLGEGELRVTVSAVGQNSKTASRSVVSVYFLYSGDMVFMSTESQLALRRLYIEALLESGAISQEQYEKSMERLLGGDPVDTSHHKPKQK